MKKVLFPFILVLGTCFSSASFANSICEKKLANIIGEAPVDAMGADFQNIFGAFLFQHQASPNNLNELALSIFKKRLELAKKYRTYFSFQLEPNWEKPNEPQKYIWNERWEGQSHQTFWSFGIKNNQERIHQIFLYFEKVLGSHNKEELVDSSQFQKIPNYTPTPQVQKMKVWEYPVTLSGKTITFKFYKSFPDAFWVAHTPDQDIPFMLMEAEKKWLLTLNKTLSFENRLRALAEFEWLWFWMNPFGRGGALTGDALSILLQKNLLEEGLNIHMRTQYLNQDLIAFSMSLEKYTSLRVKELKGP